jgi:uncharacterized protein (TIGR02145 family)
MKNIVLLIRSVYLILSVITYSCKKGEIPVLTTTEITFITTTSATSGGNIINDGGNDIISKGVCWNSTGNPTIANGRTSDGSGTESFKSSITLLLPNTYYYIRAYATNGAGTGYGNELSFATLDITVGSVNDIDGNIYKTVSIGNQVWMAENLKTTRYNDNTSIPLVSGSNEWRSLITPGYCWYNNDSSTYKSAYGALYNWYTVATYKLCPTGWHVPTHGQWSILATYLGGENVAGDKLKEAGGSHWIRLNEGASNESGFTALPGGGRINGTFEAIGISGVWWASTAYDGGNAWCRELDDDQVLLLSGYVSLSQGFSVRCIKN